MASQKCWHLFLLLFWIFKMLLPLCSGMEAPRLFFSETVFVAIRGEDIHIHYELHIPAKENKDVLICFDPNNQQFFRHAFPATGEAAFSNKAIMQLRDLRRSGEYRCQYKEAKAYFFLRLRDEYYKDFTKDTYAIVLGFFIGVLLIFSVVSSLYVFRGTWAGKKHERGNPSNDRKKNKQQADKPEEDRTGVIVTSSTSLYASLESRPRSIYDVLDRSSVNNTVFDQKKPALMPKTGHTPAKQTQSQDEGLFESVYENF